MGFASAVFLPLLVQVGCARNRKNVGVVQLQRGVLFLQLFDVTVFTIALGMI